MNVKVNISEKKINVGHTENSSVERSIAAFAFCTISSVSLVRCAISESFVAGRWY